MSDKDKNKIYVVGHKNPDTDSICSAIAYAALKSKITGKVYERRDTVCSGALPCKDAVPALRSPGADQGHRTQRSGGDQEQRLYPNGMGEDAGEQHTDSPGHKRREAGGSYNDRRYCQDIHGSL